MCSLRPWLYAGMATMLAACGGLSDVGHQDDAKTPPVAAVSVLNQPFTSDASGNVSTRVRAGTQVFMSGKDSDGVVAPVLRFKWEQVDAGSNTVTLVTRSANTVSFAAPQVTQDTALQFRLTVTDANGSSASKNVAVTVIAIGDTNQFLTYDMNKAQQLQLKATTSRDVAAGELAGQDVTFEITLRDLIDYTTPGVDGPYVQLSTRTLTGKWVAGYGTSATCDVADDPRSPSFRMDLPAVNIDDILAAVDPTDMSARPNPALVDQYRLKTEATIRVTGGVLPADAQPVVCAPEVQAAQAVVAHAKPRPGAKLPQGKQTDLASGKLELTRDEMLGNASVTLDTARSATAYYAAIDPQQQRTTLLDWFKVNGFLPGSSTTVGWTDVAAGSAAHAVYTNNFDLGFGRDMYARVGQCDDGPTPSLGGPLDVARVGQCDTAAVVINYSSLEGAAKKLNPVLAVAMEYRATPGSAGRRIVQFYTFAPDLVSGEFRRVLSANLDGRGEKFMPQVCTVCHGGAPGGLDADDTYRNAGDVNAAFLPWDLDALLYADASGPNADPSFSEESLRSQYTRSAQADSLRKMNQIAYLTFHDATRPTRHVLVRQLLDGWYGTQAGPPAQAFVNAAFDGTYTPAGWTENGIDGMPGTADDNPASSPALYHDVFARYCRACHVVQAPAPKASGDALELITDNNGTYNKCDASEPAGEAAWTGAPNQLPIGCYRQFVSARNLAQRLSEGRMPFARLTMDRFWVGPDPNGSAGDELFDHLTQAYAALPPERRPVLTVPGTASACFTGVGATFSSASAGSEVQIEPGIDYPLDGSCSLFAQQYHWTLQAPPGSAASLAYEDSTRTVLRGVDLKGEYTMTLATAPNATAQARAHRIDRPIVLPVIDDTTLSPAVGENIRDVLVNASGGDRGLALATVASADPAVIDAAIASDNSIRLTAHTVSADPVVISYTVADGDGDTAPGQFNANVKAELSANSFPAPTAATVRRTGVAGTSLPIDLSVQVAGAAGQPLKYSVSAPTRVGSDGQTGTVTVDETTGQVSYMPPQGVMSQFRTGAGLAVLTDGDVSLHDTFTYSVSYASDPDTSRTGTVTVAIEGNDTDNVSFASLYDGDLRTSCGGCHGTNTGFVAPKWFDPASDRTTFCHMRQDSTAGDPAVPYADRADPAASALYTRPTGEGGHPLLNVPALRQLLLDWIAEGANFTSDPDQHCE